ncbi:MAG: Mg/Co/Ni transporter MgtE, CBS domain-containing, partial [Olavius algarvensis Gamma 1 endosymbiont]
EHPAEQRRSALAPRRRRCRRGESGRRRRNLPAHQGQGARAPAGGVGALVSGGCGRAVPGAAPEAGPQAFRMARSRARNRKGRRPVQSGFPRGLAQGCLYYPDRQDPGSYGAGTSPTGSRRAPGGRGATSLAQAQRARGHQGAAGPRRGLRRQHHEPQVRRRSRRLDHRDGDRRDPRQRPADREALRRERGRRATAANRLSQAPRPAAAAAGGRRPRGDAHGFHRRDPGYGPRGGRPSRGFLRAQCNTRSGRGRPTGGTHHAGPSASGHPGRGGGRHQDHGRTRHRHPAGRVRPAHRARARPLAAGRADRGEPVGDDRGRLRGATGAGLDPGRLHPHRHVHRRQCRHPGLDGGGAGAGNRDPDLRRPRLAVGQRADGRTRQRYHRGRGLGPAGALAVAVGQYRGPATPPGYRRVGGNDRGHHRGRRGDYRSRRVGSSRHRPGHGHGRVHHDGKRYSGGADLLSYGDPVLFRL